MAYRDKYEIRQGRIQLYRRTAEGGKHQSDAWYCALKIAGQKTIRKSLQTVIREDAERKAENIWLGSTPLLRTLLKRGTLCQRSVHVQKQEIQSRIQT